MHSKTLTQQQCPSLPSSVLFSADSVLSHDLAPAWDGGDSVPASLDHMFLQSNRKVQLPTGGTAYQPGERGREGKGHQEGGHLQSLFSGRRYTLNQPTPPHRVTVQGEGTDTSVAEKAEHPGQRARLPCWQRPRGGYPKGII